MPPYLLLPPTEVYVPVGYLPVEPSPRRPHHLLHATLFLLTGGLSLPFWIRSAVRAHR